METDDGSVRRVLENVESEITPDRIDESFPVLAYVAGRAIGWDADELHAARRRAVLLLATRGDPRRGLDPDSRAVTALAADVDSEERRAQLTRALRRLRSGTAGLPLVREALDRLLADDDLAWRWLAVGLVAEELAEDSA